LIAGVITRYESRRLEDWTLPDTRHRAAAAMAVTSAFVVSDAASVSSANGQQVSRSAGQQVSIDNALV
jgi:hypothetical protein